MSVSRPYQGFQTFRLHLLVLRSFQLSIIPNPLKGIGIPARIVKFLRDGVPQSEIIATLGIYEENLLQWAYHYFEGGLTGLLQLNSHKNK